MSNGFLLSLLVMVACACVYFWVMIGDNNE